MTATLATLSQATERDQYQPFIAISLDEGSDKTKIQALTPRVMHWSKVGTKDIWILDLQACETYWRAQAKRRNMGVVDLWRMILEDAGGQQVCAALAPHPWQAVLLLQCMQERKLTGVLSARGRLGKNVLRDLPWSAFWTCTEQVSHQFESSSRRHFNPATLRRQIDQMQRAVKRLGIKQPSQLSNVEPNAIKRRFGTTIKDLWQWTYTEEENQDELTLFTRKQDKLFKSGFPWMSYEFPNKPSISRHLDYPLVLWEHIEPLLRDDLDRLCSLDTWQVGERVVSLEWRIVFRDMTTLKVRVLFRHPHSLHSEANHHGTTLLQALYSFEAAIPGSPLDEWRFGKDDPAAPITPIVSWDLSIEERLTLPPSALGLFGEHADQEQLALLDLDNRLAVPLEEFALREDWLPEDSFQLNPSLRERGEYVGLVCRKQQSIESGSGEDTGALSSLVALGHARPLFIYRKPVKYSSEGRSSVWRFTERTMAKWWATDKEREKRPLQRDYYRMIDHEQKEYWVFRDNTTKHGDNTDGFIQGVFG